MNKKCLLLFSLLAAFLVSCGQAPVQKEETVATETLPEPETEAAPEPVPEAAGCEYNADCEQGWLCINRECKTLASLYKTDCENKCTITGVKVATSDGEEYDLTLGQGSYTAAGALEWKLLKTPDYCQGEDPLVALNIIKKTTGKVVGEQVLTLHKGETSEAVTHPTVKSVKFTATLADMTEKCS
ncbi:MAG: hypothetical protein Q8R47_02005 [Nanoarchaeota archaeon]|nr:hypothetical protein [Nanoarchaeota archaeon]